MKGTAHEWTADEACNAAAGGQVSRGGRGRLVYVGRRANGATVGDDVVVNRAE
jgi:hypothetical protein